MTNRFLLSLACTLCLFCCSNVSTDPITAELMLLNNSMDKQNYLEKIYFDHEGKTKNLPPNIGEINLKKVGGYLELFGYPNRSAVGNTAANVPWYVMHAYDAEDRIDIRRKYFPILFKAYLSGDIIPRQMSLFLNRFYEFKFGEKFEYSSPKGTKEEINKLIVLLQLETSLK